MSMGSWCCGQFSAGSGPGYVGCTVVGRQYFPYREPDLYPRAQAYTALGLDAYLLRHPESGPVREGLRNIADSLLHSYRKHASASWKWFEDFLTYDNARLPQALLIGYRHLSEPDYLRVALEALDFLTEVQYQDGYFDLIGNEGWYQKGGEKAIFSQQPLDAGALVETFLLARLLTGENKYLELAYAALQWFLGRNRLGVSLYDSIIGSCCDGLDPGRPSKNKGRSLPFPFFWGCLPFINLGQTSFRSKKYRQT